MTEPTPPTLAEYLSSQLKGAMDKGLVGAGPPKKNALGLVDETRRKLADAANSTRKK